MSTRIVTASTERQRGSVIVGALALSFGALFGGIEGLVIAALGVGLTAWRGPRWTIGAALGLFLVAVVVLFMEQPLTDPYARFASDRELTSALARTAGIVAMVGVLELCRVARRQVTGATAGEPTERERGWSWWWLVAGFAALAIVAVFTNSRGRYITDLLIGDNHFSLFFNPGELLDRQWSLWDPLHGLGRTRNNFWPVPTGVTWLIHSIGVDAITAQRIWHAAILTGAGVGMAVLLRVLRRRPVGFVHVAAGLVYMFVPVSAVTLHSSYFLLSYALAPWFAAVFVLGVRSAQPWRWAAVFALLFFIPGNPNYASLIDALVPIVLIAVFLVHVERSMRWPVVIAWLARAAVLTVLVSSAALVTTRFETDVIAGNVNGTELPSHVAGNSSWLESMRGLGWWLLYFRDRGVVLEQFGPYFTSVLIILASVAAPIGALVAIGWTKARERLLFAILLLVGAGIMVGGFPADDPSPFGKLILDGFSEVTVLKGFRGTYKAGAVLALGLAGLIGYGLAVVLGRGSTRRRVSIAVLATVVFLAATFPFWTDSLYRRQEDLREIPTYYEKATRWLDRQPAGGRVLVLPSTVEAVYMWGSAGDDIIDSLLDRPHIVRAQVDAQLGTPQAANLLAALDDYLNTGRARPGVLAPIARRLGIEYLLLRNDLDWRFIARPEPSAFDVVRDDPDVQEVAAFGRPGEHVSPGRTRVARSADAGRPPVEIFRIEGVESTARVATGPELLVSGDGASWPGLARGGFLDDTGPLRYTGDLNDGDLADALERGSGVVISDGNRRQVQTIPGITNLASVSAPLPAGGAVAERGLASLFEPPATQSVAVYGQAAALSESNSGLASNQPDVRPANAFDSVGATAWLTGALVGDVAGDWLEVKLAAPQPVDEVQLDRAAFGRGDREISTVDLEFSDGTTVPVKFVHDSTTVRFAPRTTSSVRITIAATTGRGRNAVGFSEVAIGNLDLSERIRLPTDVVDAAGGEQRVAAALRKAPLSFQLTRRDRVTPRSTPIEVELHRSLVVPFDATFEVTGMVSLGQATSPTILDELRADGPVGFTGSTGPSDHAPSSGCRRDVVSVDYQSVPVRIEADAAAAANAPGRPPFRFVACEPVTLAPGGHVVDSLPGTTVDDVWITTGPPIPAGDSRPAHTTERSGGSVSVNSRAPSLPASAIIGESYDDGWEATIDGRDAGAPISLDAQSAWPLRSRDHFELRASFAPERLYTAAVVVTGLTLLACLWLALAPQRLRRRPGTRGGAHDGGSNERRVP